MKRLPDGLPEGAKGGPEIDVGAIENPADDTAGLVPSDAQQDGSNTGSRRRRHLIAVAAYLRAEQRQFQNGSPEEDWLQAEAEIDHQLSKGQISGQDA